MKKLLLSLLVVLFAVNVIAQEESDKKTRKLPVVNVKTADGKPFSTKEINNDGNPIIVSFWALWCKPCIKAMPSQSGQWPIMVSVEMMRLFTA